MSAERSSLPWGRFAAEFVVIVVGVLVALGVDQWAEGQSNQGRARDAMRTLEAEMSENYAQLLRRLGYHESIVPGLDSLVAQAGRGEVVRLTSSDALPQGLGFWLLRNTAWETAKVTDALRHFDPATLQVLSLTYSLQDALRLGEDAIARGILSPEWFVAEDQAGPAVFLRGMLGDVITNERELRGLLEGSLELVRDELGLPPEGSEPLVEIS